MFDLKNYALTLAELKHAGYPADWKFVSFSMAEKMIGKCAESNRLLLIENSRWAKELEFARNKIDLLMKTSDSK